MLTIFKLFCQNLNQTKTFLCLKDEIMIFIHFCNEYDVGT